MQQLGSRVHSTPLAWPVCLHTDWVRATHQQQQQLFAPAHCLRVYTRFGTDVPAVLGVLGVPCRAVPCAEQVFNVSLTSALTSKEAETLAW